MILHGTFLPYCYSALLHSRRWQSCHAGGNRRSWESNHNPTSGSNSSSCCSTALQEVCESGALAPSLPSRGRDASQCTVAKLQRSTMLQRLTPYLQIACTATRHREAVRECKRGITAGGVTDNNTGASRM